MTRALPLPPRDPLLGPIDVALRGPTVAEIVAARLPECASGAVAVERCEPVYAKYRPGRYWRVSYALTLRTPDGRSLEMPAHATLARNGRAAKLWADPGLHALVARAADVHPGPPGARAAELPELGALLQVFPVDVRLPGLTIAASGEAMASRLVGWTGCSAELVRYKPGRRAVLRYRSGWHVAYGKLRSDRRGHRLLEVGSALRAAGLPVPEPLACVRDLGLAVVSEIEGVSLRELRGGAFDAWMESVAEALARLHATRLSGLSRLDARAEGKAVAEAGRLVGALVPALAPEAERLGRRLAAEVARPDRAGATLHGSFHDDQVLVSPAGVAFVDLDSAGTGDPLRDVAHFLSYLSAGGRDAAHARFLDAYAATRTLSRRVILLEAAALLRWASLPFRELEPDWPDGVAARVRLAASRLAYGRHGVRAGFRSRSPQ